MDLLELAKETKTNKPDYYLELYQNRFREIRLEKLDILEIGIDKGGSVFMWSKYFPNSRVVAMDIGDLPDGHVVPEGFEWYKGDQANLKDLEPLMNRQYDLIIDDASHINYDMQFTLGTLFPLVKPQRFYFIEDLGTRRRHKNECRDTRKVMNQFIKTKKMSSTAMSKKQQKYLTDNVQTCEIHNRIVVIQKSG